MIRPLSVLVATALSLLSLPPAAAEEPLCAPATFENTQMTVCTVDPAKDDLRLAWRDARGTPYRSFHRLEAALAEQNLTLRMAMNGGMYDRAHAPIGLYMEDGAELMAANTAKSTKKPEPNFYKKPNGIFLFGPEPLIMETERYLRERPAARFATQSGPMLVIDGKLHPALIPRSRDRQRRNGVGVDAQGRVRLVISEEAVNFHDFARFFRDELGCANALYLDGGHAPGLHDDATSRSDWPGHGGFGPIIAVIGKADS